MIKNLYNHIRILKRKYQSKKISYSLSSVDLIVDYIFKYKNDGLYIDVGCQHPIFNNNTYILYKKGWNGINIDLDKKNIDLFNISRPDDTNINIAVSDKSGNVNLFYYHDGSPINTINSQNADYQKNKFRKIKLIKSETLNKILANINFNKKVDYLNIDVEGHELNVLKGFNILKYRPSIISIEYLDYEMKKLELKNNNLKNIINSNIYKYLIQNKYFFVNWVHGDLIFAHKNFRD
ncbi:FkbM family methyltransferase [Candidatus Pelagibacter sp.]|nr:FkbM family methyltransferase [Candidatus Pelagibacter sp.]